jgi:hypothetical protein
MPVTGSVAILRVGHSAEGSMRGPGGIRQGSVRRETCGKRLIF